MKIISDGIPTGCVTGKASETNLGRKNRKRGGDINKHGIRQDKNSEMEREH